MKKCGLMWIYVSALVIMFCAQLEADNYHCKVEVEADSKEVKEWEEVNPIGEFDKPPVHNVADLIEVNNARKRVGKDILPDPVNSNVKLEWEDPDDVENANVRVLRRENDRLVYSVKVELEVEEEGDGPGIGEPPIGWAEARDKEPGDLLLKDEISGREETDSTIEDDDRPLLYCCTDDDGKGKVFFQLKNAYGKYDWEIPGAATPSGFLTEACEGGCAEEENCEGYCYKVTDIDPGYYTLTVNADGGYEKDFKRIIDFVVVWVKFANGSPDPEVIGAEPIPEEYDNVNFTSIIEIETIPVGYEGEVQLKIGEIDRDYPGKGDLSRKNQSTWEYNSFLEPKSDKSPETVSVPIKAKLEGNQCDEVEITVKPVYNYLLQDGPSQTAWDDGRLKDAKGYIIWKYDVPTANIEDWDYEHLLDVDQPGTAAIHENGEVIFGRLAFHESIENVLANVIGHENVHAGQEGEKYEGVAGTYLAEVEAYAWNIENAEDTCIYTTNVGLFHSFVEYFRAHCRAYRDHEQGDEDYFYDVTNFPENFPRSEYNEWPRWPEIPDDPEEDPWCLQ